MWTTDLFFMVPDCPEQGKEVQHPWNYTLSDSVAPNNCDNQKPPTDSHMPVENQSPPTDPRAYLLLTGAQVCPGLT